MSTDPVGRLVHIEALKQLKARYFRLLDTKQWAEFRGVFTDDLIVEFDGQAAPIATSGDEYVTFVSRRAATSVTIHHGHMAEIELLSATSARGVWAMYDWVDDPDHERAFEGVGHYHETYRLGPDGMWRISSLRLDRLRIDPRRPSVLPIRRTTPAGAHQEPGASASR
jgi:hypothetical protein